MTQHECLNVTQVAQKVAELTKTKYAKDTWKGYCKQLKETKSTSDTIDYTAFDEQGNERDVSIFLGYDIESRTWLVGMEEL